MNTRSARQCPRCGKVLDEIELPDGSGWEQDHQWVCFNDDCSYYKEGWDWMWENYRIHASYRFRLLSLESGRSSPLAVWSDTAVRDRICAPD